MNEVTLEIMEKIEKYEPRVESCEVSFEGTDEVAVMNGSLKAKVVCSLA